MLRQLFILILVAVAADVFSQKRYKDIFPKVAIGAQYAGSVGLFSGGASIVSKKDKLEAGLFYGRLPRAYGTITNSFVFKVTYNPFQITVFEKLKSEPIQAGIFINQNFSKNLGLRWQENYPKGYYWWDRSTRVHLFLSTQLSYKINRKHFDRLSVYLETNTNDLYISSYLVNRKTVRIYDIFFLGTGLKVYLR